MPAMKPSCLPFFASGPVIKGFGRGSKELGIPTANFPTEVIETLPKEWNTGIYFGFANVDSGPVYKMVMSIGWNPFYKNVQKSMETHILHQFPSDFYGQILKVCILGYIRPEQSYDSLDALIQAIKSDIAYAENNLDSLEFKDFKQHSFFSCEKSSSSTNGIDQQIIGNGDITPPSSSL